jgi:hypothetical protein
MWGAFFTGVLVCALIFGVIPSTVVFMTNLVGIEAETPLVWRVLCGCCKKRKPAAERDPASPHAAAPSLSRALPRVVQVPVEYIEKLDGFLKEAPIIRTFGCCLNYGQTCYSFSMLENVAWPWPSIMLLKFTKLLLIDVEFMKPDCIIPLPYFTKWTIKMYSPLLFIGILICIALYVDTLVKKKGHTAKRGKSVWSAFWFTMAVAIHVFLVIHVKVVLSPVDCNWCRKGVMCLDEYTLVECWTDDPTWQTMMIMSTIDFVFVSGAFPIFLAYAIRVAWRRTQDAEGNAAKPGLSSLSGGDVEPLESPQRLSRSLANVRVMGTQVWKDQPPSVTQDSFLVDFANFYVRGYRGKQDGGSILTFGWEFVILLRKLALILSAKFTTAYPITGANLQLIILFVSLILQFTYKPYVDNFLNSLDIAFTTLAFGTLLSATQLTFFRDGKTDNGYPIAPDWMISFYWWFNVIALIGGSAVAAVLCIRKLQHSWEEKERQKESQRTKDEVESLTISPADPPQPAEESGLNLGDSARERIFDIDVRETDETASRSAKSESLKEENLSQVVV